MSKTTKRAKPAKVITWRALTQRINRELKKKGQQLVAQRAGLSRRVAREYVIVGVDSTESIGDEETVVAFTHKTLRRGVDIERLARRLGVLKKYEGLDQDAERHV